MVIEAINAGLAQISIHALRVEGDGVHLNLFANHRRISIHALRVEGDLYAGADEHAHPDFYPRPPGGGRQRYAELSRKESDNFYPRPPGGGRRRIFNTGTPWHKISIHALRVEGDGALCLR